MKAITITLFLVFSWTSSATRFAPCDINLLSDVKEVISADLNTTVEVLDANYLVKLEKTIENPLRLKIYSAVFVNDGNRGRPLFYVFKMSSKKPQHVFGCEILDVLTP